MRSVYGAEVTLFQYLFCQAADYRENKFHTGWLDSRIAMRVRAERPPWYLSVVGGALYVSNAFLYIFFSLSFC